MAGQLCLVRHAGRALLASAWLLATACADLPSSARPTPEPIDPESLPPFSHGDVRRILSDDETRFGEIVAALSDAEVTGLAAVQPQPAALQQHLAPDGEPVRAKLQRLAERDSGRPPLASGAPPRTELRRAIMDAVDGALLGKLAIKLREAEQRRIEFCRNKSPRIHNLGSQSFLVFEGKPAAGTTTAHDRAIRIPVDGRDLHPRCVYFGVTIGGTVPLGGGPDDYNNELYITYPTESHPDIANIILKTPLVDRMKTGDVIVVSVNASERAQYWKADRNRVVSFASRAFNLYEIEDFRSQVLRARIQPQDIAAFPLPDQDAEYLFGPLVRENYFVVRLSLRNTDAEAKLVSTGMIRAFGRAIVEPNIPDHPSFTVPVTVVPHSLQQIFKILDDEEVNQPRALAYRTLEFSGSLLTALNAAFSSSLRAAKNIGLFSGTFIPESKRLWPDRWPGYKSNIVTFAMPDLIKVPPNSVTDHRFLFFAKKDIEGVVADHNLYAPRGALPGTLVPNIERARSRGSLTPNVRVIALAFDTLDIRFEKVFEIAKLSVRDEIAALTVRLPRQIDQLRNLRANWDDSREQAAFLGTLSIAAVKAAEQNIEEAAKPFDGRNTGDPKDEDVKGILAQVKNLLVALRPPAKDGLAGDLLQHSEHGLEKLIRMSEELALIRSRIAAGVDAEQFASEAKSIRGAADRSQASLVFYESAAKAVGELPGLIEALQRGRQTLAGAATADRPQALGKLRDDLAKVVSSLKGLAGTRPGDTVLSAVDWKKIQALP